MITSWYKQYGKIALLKALESTAVSIFLVTLVELTNTAFVNSTNISTNIETAVLSKKHYSYCNVLKNVFKSPGWMLVLNWLAQAFKTCFLFAKKLAPPGYKIAQTRLQRLPTMNIIFKCCIPCQKVAHKKVVVVGKKTRPSVNYAKDWLDHSFLFPGLVWSEKDFHFGCVH